MSRIIEASTQMEVSAPAQALLAATDEPRDAIQQLLDGGHDEDALKLLARLLPKRYAVAWLCQCAREEPLNLEDRAGASLAEAWVRDPAEGNRRAALEFANAGRYRSLGAWLAAAAGWSGGSLAPASQETPVPPAEHLTARAVAAAATLMAALERDSFSERRRGYMQRAMSLLGEGGGAQGTTREN